LERFKQRCVAYSGNEDDFFEKSIKEQTWQISMGPIKNKYKVMREERKKRPKVLFF